MTVTRPGCDYGLLSVRRRVAVRLPALGLLVFCASPAPGQDAGRQNRQPAPVAASNQAVSLDALEPSPGDVEPRDHHVPGKSAAGHDESPAGGPEQEPGGRQDALPRIDSMPTRHMISSRATASSRPSYGLESPQSWYRTGLGSLAIVLAVIAGVYLAIRRFVPGARAAGMDAVKVVGRTALSPKHTVALLQVGRRFVLVALAGDRVWNICEVSDPEEAAELAAQTGTVLHGGGRGFDAALLSEATGYSRGVMELGEAEARGIDTSVDDVVKAARGARPAARKPVTELLGRLRELQAK